MSKMNLLEEMLVLGSAITNQFVLWEHEREELRSDVLLPEFVNVKTLTAWKSRSDWE